MRYRQTAPEEEWRGRIRDLLVGELGLPELSMGPALSIEIDPHAFSTVTAAPQGSEVPVIIPEDLDPNFLRSVKFLENSPIRAEWAGECAKVLRQPGHHLLILGPTRSGKTSLILTIKSILEQEDFLIIHNQSGTSLEPEKTKKDIFENFFIFTDEGQKKYASNQILQASFTDLAQVIHSLCQTEGVQWSGKKLILSVDESFDYMTLESNQKESKSWFPDFLQFLAEVRNFQLPINILAASWGSSFPFIMDLLDSDRKKARALFDSIFYTQEWKLLSQSESIQLLNFLLKAADAEFASEGERQNFIETVVHLCSGQIALLNYAVKELITHKSSLEVYLSLKHTLIRDFSLGRKSVYFGVYFKKMTPVQRNWVSQLCLAKDNTGTLLNAQSHLDELEEIKRMGYIDYQLHPAGSTAQVKLLAVEGFKHTVYAALCEKLNPFVGKNLSHYVTTHPNIDSAALELAEVDFFFDWKDYFPLRALEKGSLSEPFPLDSPFRPLFDLMCPTGDFSQPATMPLKEALQNLYYSMQPQGTFSTPAEKTMAFHRSPSGWILGALLEICNDFWNETPECQSQQEAFKTLDSTKKAFREELLGMIQQGELWVDLG